MSIPDLAHSPSPGFGGKPVTVGRDGKPLKKAFRWSYSKLKNFEACPKKTWHIDWKKDFKEAEGEALLWGNSVHKAFHERISTGKPFPLGMERYEAWAVKMLAGTPHPSIRLLTEQQLAINENFGPTSWFPSDAEKKGTGAPWYSGIGDVIKIVGPVALIVDWKTGKIVEDSQQLALMSACVFAHHPEVLKVRAMFAWLKDDAETTQDFHRNDMAQMWKHLWPRIEALKNAVDNSDFPAKPGGLCKRWCPVTACAHHGE